MKSIKKLLLVVLCLSLLQVPAVSFAGPATVSAATTQKGLVKENGNYYYYLNGKKIKNTWRNITAKNSKGVKETNRYYFDKNGKAYKAPYNKEAKYSFVVKTIGGKKYGFDQEGHMIKGVYVMDSHEDSKMNLIAEAFYVFNSKTGVYNASQSKTLNNYVKKAMNASKQKDRISAFKSLKARLINYHKLKYTQKNEGKSCFVIGYTDYSLIFGHFVLQYAGKKINSSTYNMVYTIAFSR